MQKKLSISQIHCPIEDILFYDLPKSDFENREYWMRNARSKLSEHLKGIPDANQRRSMRAKLFKRGKFTPFAISLLREQQRAAIDSVSKKLPELLPLVQRGGMYDLMCRTASSETFRANFRKAFGNPVTLAHLAKEPELAELMEMSKFLWAQSEAIATRISTMIEGLINLQLRAPFIGFKFFRAEINKTFGSENGRLQLASALAGIDLAIEKLRHMPATSLMVDAYIQYALDKIDAHANLASEKLPPNFKFKRSDVADIMHLAYLPYVDAFGCDRYVKDLVRRISKHTHVFTSDNELSSLIES